MIGESHRSTRLGFRVRETAEQWGVSVRTVRRWIADGTLPSVKIGGARIVLPLDPAAAFAVDESRTDKEDDNSDTYPSVVKALPK
jgi:excisionase family DNA binding protein